MRDAVFHVGDGTPIVVTFWDKNGIIIDISEAETKQILLTSPTGTAADFDGEFFTDGTDGKLRYDPAEEDVFEAGTWQIQGFVIINDIRYHSVIEYFPVERNLI